MIRRAALLDRAVQQRDARLYVLAVEGAETEPAYFRALDVEPSAPCPQLPSTRVYALVERMRRAR